jgi:hypothetical protein
MMMAFAVITIMHYADAADTRVTLNINPGWKFTKGDISGAQASSFNDASWSSA